ncbi:MAG: hypothetical protein AAFR76_11355 [Planctomycetota bacterium]
MQMHAKAFVIKQCGYYQRGEKDVPQYGGADELADLIGDWTIEELPIQETKTYESGEYGELLPVYFMGVHSIPRTDEFLLRLWNQTDVAGDQFGSVIGHSTVNAPDVRESEVPTGGIPGFPSYYWFFPSLEKVIGLRFNTRTHGHPGLNMFLKNFLSHFSHHVVESEDGEVLGYAKDDEEEPSHMYPRFHTAPMRLPGVVDQIRRHRPGIYKLLHRKELLIDRRPDRAMLTKVLEFIGMNQPELPAEDAGFQFEVDYKPTNVALEEILDKYQSGDYSEWDDIGFKVTGLQSPIWLGARQKTVTLETDVQPGEGGLVELPQLVNRLSRLRTRLLRDLGIH